MSEAFAPEISDLIVDYDPDSLARRPVAKEAVVARLRASGHAPPLRVAMALPANGGVLDPDAMDHTLVRAHLELQRLHEEFRVGATIQSLLAPLVALAKEATNERPIRVADIGCGIGYVARWLASRRALGDDVELVGVDYNRALLSAARDLAREERVPCAFLNANAFRLKTPAHVYVSTGVLHHFRGKDLVRFFGEHDQARTVGLVHVDIRPWWASSIGSWIFHQARMLEPLARWDGYWSAVRAHEAATLSRAVRDGLPGFRRAMVDARAGLLSACRIFQAIVAVREEHAGGFDRAFASLGRRVTEAS